MPETPGAPMVKKGIIFWIACSVSMICGCDPVTNHKITTIFFEGVPSMPPAEQYCRDYHEKKVAEELEAAKKKQTAEPEQIGSIHLPYGEKRCDDCHNKATESGLIRPRNEICFVCHTDIINGFFVHGPASVGGCLECHEPHSSAFPSLLKADRKKLCVGCHQEKRDAQGLHDKAVANGMLCMDCHDPHTGTVPYFLR